MNERFSHTYVYSKEIQVSWLVTMHCAMHANHALISQQGDEHVHSVLPPRT